MLPKATHCLLNQSPVHYVAEMSNWKVTASSKQKIFKFIDMKFVINRTRILVPFSLTWHYFSCFFLYLFSSLFFPIVTPSLLQIFFISLILLLLSIFPSFIFLHFSCFVSFHSHPFWNSHFFFYPYFSLALYFFNLSFIITLSLLPSIFLSFVLSWCVFFFKECQFSCRSI